MVRERRERGGRSTINDQRSTISQLVRQPEKKKKKKTDDAAGLDPLVCRDLVDALLEEDVHELVKAAKNADDPAVSVEFHCGALFWGR